MSAAAAIEAARAAGIRVEIDGDELMLGALAPPPSSVLELLSRHKAGIVALLRSADHGWSTEDWQAFFDERAGIAEFDGGLSRGSAEARAFDCCVAEWLTAIPCAYHLGGVSTVAVAIVRMISCFPTARRAPALAGCTRAARPPGTPAGRPRLSARWERWGSRYLP